MTKKSLSDLAIECKRARFFRLHLKSRAKMPRKRQVRKRNEQDDATEEGFGNGIVAGNAIGPV